MALTYGFFDSINKDRVYNADQFSGFLDGIINDGIYQAVGGKFYVWASNGMSSDDGMKLIVDTGRAWFDHTWTLNTTRYPLTISAADAIYARIDAVVLEVNKNDRRNYIKVVKGSPAVNPIRPSLTRTPRVKQYALAYVTVPKLATIIYQSNIRNVVGDETPLVSAILLSGIPSGGKIGQVLAKKSSESGAVDWYDIDKLPYDVWYLADGVSESDVLAAYGFKNAGTEQKALKNINEKTNYPLAKSSASVTFATDRGFTIPGKEFLNNEMLRKTSPVTVAFKFSDITDMNGTFCLHGGHIAAPLEDDWSGIYVNMPYGVQSYIARVNPYFGGSGDGTRENVDPMKEAKGVRTAPGVLSATFRGADPPTMYYNGTLLELTNITDQGGQEVTIGPRGYKAKLIGGSFDLYANWKYTTLTIQGAVFYNKALSANQHNQLYRQMTAAFG